MESKWFCPENIHLRPAPSKIWLKSPHTSSSNIKDVCKAEPSNANYCLPTDPIEETGPDLLNARTKTRGKRTLSSPLLVQLSNQKFVFEPFPMRFLNLLLTLDDTTKLLSKRDPMRLTRVDLQLLLLRVSIKEFGTAPLLAHTILLHNRLFSFPYREIHLTSNAAFISPRSGIPSPPLSQALVIVSQWTMCIFLLSSEPPKWIYSW